MYHKAVGFMVVGAVLSLGLTGCATKKIGQGEATSTFDSVDRFSSQDPWGRTESELMATRTYHFGFDRYDLSDKDKYAVNAHARYLQQHPGSQVTLEGYTDERGSHEYNIALGERRAKAVQEQLESSGVHRNQMRVVSYGKERVASGGHDEASWAENRRAILVHEEKGF